MKLVIFLMLTFGVVTSPFPWSVSWGNPPLAVSYSSRPPPYTIPTISPLQPVITKGKVDPSPQFLSNNYIPAAMHVLFHLSDLMKYEVRPPASTAAPGGPSSTTVRPTQPHRPGNYAPERPQGPPGFYSDRNSPLAWSYGWGNIKGGLSPEIIPQSSSTAKKQKEILPEDIDLFGAGPFELLHQINTLEDTDTIADDEDDVHIERFSINYEDSVNLDFLRQKRVPPTKAFVIVLSLFDALNKESKELGLNKFNGYSESMLRELQKTSEGTSSDQLKYVLQKIIDKRNTRKDNILRKIKQMIIDLENSNSYLSMAIRYIPALQFAL